MKGSLPLFGILVAGSAFGSFSDRDSWGCRTAHPAVVNPVGAVDSPWVLSLRGRWSYAFGIPASAYTRRNSHDNPLFADTVDWAKAPLVSVPGCWEGGGVGNAGLGEPWRYPGTDSSSRPLRHKFVGELWYRKTVTIPAAWKDRRIWLKIGGVNSVGWFWVNRHQVAYVESYCGAYKYDVTDCVKPGLTAEVLTEISTLHPSRKGEHNHTHRWGGLLRDVEFEATPKAMIDDAQVVGNFDARTAEAHVRLDGIDADGFRVRVSVEGRSAECAVDPGTTAAMVVVPLHEFRPWSPEHPNLYWANVELFRDGRVVHSRRERFGVRKLEVRGREFHLNGKPFFLRGFGDDAVYPLSGASPADREFHLKHLRTMRKAGFNYVRTHTRCELPEYFEAADEAGILVQAELPYMNGDMPGDNGRFDPCGDQAELFSQYRRYVSFATCCGGNEGSFGPRLDALLYREAKALDAGVLHLSMDSQFERINRPDNSDFTGGPVNVWPRGVINPDRPFVCHEYLNRCVKQDSRLSGRFTGLWEAPTSREQREKTLKGVGLDLAWGDRLQDAQHALQAYWQKQGVEAARADPYCDGYCFWLGVDLPVRFGASWSAQGLFNVFWEPKERGWKPEQFARFNSPAVTLFDFPEDRAVFTSGETISIDVLLANFDADTAADASKGVEWKLVCEGRTLRSGREAVDAATLVMGPGRTVATLRLTMPTLERTAKVTLVASVGGLGENDRDLWLFPVRKVPDGSFLAASEKLHGVLSKLYANVRHATDAEGAEIVLAEEGSPLLEQARRRGQRTIAVGEAKPSPPIDGVAGEWTLGRDPKTLPKGGRLHLPSRDVSLGWWWMGNQAGTAFLDHPALSRLPHEGVLSPLFFDVIAPGRKLPVAGLDARQLIVVGEGGYDFFAYFAEPVRGRELATWGLRLFDGGPAGAALLDGLVGYLRSGGRSSCCSAIGSVSNNPK